MAGTLRDNLDPRGTYSDPELWDAVRQVHLAAPVDRAALPGERFAATSLEMEVFSGGSNFSAGGSHSNAPMTSTTEVYLLQASASWSLSRERC